MAYSELVKNFEKVREYMRSFYIYGFKSRSEYDRKSARSYDDERRRIDNWLGEYMGFTRAEGKNIFLSMDSRVIQKNPFYRAWKTKSFTDGDITLHFAVFGLLDSPEKQKTLAELQEEIFELLPPSFIFDESTLRKKLNEYCKEGLIRKKKQGKHLTYSRSPDASLTELTDSIDFFSEAAPCGVIGSYLQDRLDAHIPVFSFKHHYMLQALDSDILAVLFEAMQKKCSISADYFRKTGEKADLIRIIPLKIYISVQNGRQHLIGVEETGRQFFSCRVDRISNLKIGEVCPDFDRLRKLQQDSEPYMWGVNCGTDLQKLRHVEFEIRVNEKESYIAERLMREKRCGQVTQTDKNHYCFAADVWDPKEMIPWIRTFICRITRLSLSDPRLEDQFWKDLDTMYQMYGIEENTK